MPELSYLTHVWAVPRLICWGPLIFEAANTGQPVGYLMKERAGTSRTLQWGPVRQWELLHLLGLLTLFLAERGAGSSFQRSVKASWFAFTSKHDLSFSKILFFLSSYCLILLYYI